MNENERIHFKIALPVELKKRLEHEAIETRRSLSAEIIARLEASFVGDDLTAGWSEGDIDILAEVLAQKLNMKSTRPKSGERD